MTGPALQRPLVFVVFGPGGVGKGTLVSRLMAMRDGLWLSRSWTTRARRPGEPEDAYVFATTEEFEARLQAGGFVEWTRFPANGRLYGTPTLELPPGREGDDILLEIETHGARQIAGLYPDAVLILVAAPSPEVQEQRLRRRGDDDESVRRRLFLGAQEEALGRSMAHHIVVNDDLERASGQLAGIIDSCRQERGTNDRSAV